MYDTEPELWYRILRCANRMRDVNASDFYGTKYRGLEVEVSCTSFLFVPLYLLQDSH